MTKEIVKAVTGLRPHDLQSDAVWKYVNRDSDDETLVRAVKRVPVTSLTGKIVGARVQLANDTMVWGLLGNIDAWNAR